MNTSSDPVKTQPRRAKHWARRTHRFCALFALVFLVQLSVTGILLNHADSIGLSKNHLSSVLAGVLYGIKSPPVDRSFDVAGNSYASSGGFLFVGPEVVASATGEILGAVSTNDIVVAATSREFIVFTKGGNLIERATNERSAREFRLGLNADRVVVNSNGELFGFDPNSMESTPSTLEYEDVTWSEPSKLETRDMRAIQNRVVGNSITWERAVSDIHNGRIVPRIGSFLTDLSAICLLYLCITGLIMWFRR